MGEQYRLARFIAGYRIRLLYIYNRCGSGIGLDKLFIFRFALHFVLEIPNPSSILFYRVLHK